MTEKTNRLKYNFTTVWHIVAPPSIAKQAIYDVETWQTWWRGLENLRIIKSEEDHIGDIAALTWRSQSGYRLHTTIMIIDITPEGDLMFTSTGDLVGNGSWHFDTGLNGETIMTIRWDVTPTKWWMRRLNVLLRPVFTANHHRVMHDGEVGLNQHLQPHLQVKQSAASIQ